MRQDSRLSGLILSPLCSGKINCEHGALFRLILSPMCSGKDNCEHEQSYVTAAFFRHRAAERYKAMMQAQQTAKLLGEGMRLSSSSSSALGC